MPTERKKVRKRQLIFGKGIKEGIVLQGGGTEKTVLRRLNGESSEGVGWAGKRGKPEKV